METIADLADIEALERIPLQARDLPRSNYESIRAVAAELPDHPALHFVFDAAAYDKPFSYTYTDLVGSITRTANMLNGLGLGHDEVVSIVLPNLPQTYFAFLGGQVAGIANPINPLLESQTMAEIMNAAGTKVLVTLGPFPGVDLWEKVASILDQVPSLETVLQVDLGRFVTGLEEGAVGPARDTANVRARVLDFDRTAAGYPADTLSSGRAIRADEVASYFHTGGTTGTPKLAQHTHFNEVYDAWAAAQVIAPGPDTVMFCGLPLFHVNGVTVTGLLPWGRGSTVVLGTPQGYRGTGVIQNFWKMVEHYRINFFSGVPTVYGSLLDVPLGDSDVGSLEFALCGAAPMPAEVFREFERRTGVRILEGYGLTEGACVSSINPAHGDRRVGSIGLRLPYQEMRTAVLEGDGGFARFCEPGEIGTVIVRGPNVFPGYREDVHNRAAFVETGAAGPVAQHRRPRPPGRGRLLLADRPQEGDHHPRRAQHRPQADRRSPAPARGGGAGGRRGAPRRAPGRGAGGLRPACTRGDGDGRQTAVVRARCDRRAAAVPKAIRCCGPDARDGRGQDLQTAAGAARVGGCLQAGAGRHRRRPRGSRGGHPRQVLRDPGAREREGVSRIPEGGVKGGDRRRVGPVRDGLRA